MGRVIMVFKTGCFSLQVMGLRAVIVIPLIGLLIFSACAKPGQPLPDVATKDVELIRALPDKRLTFNDIRPTLEKRCIVCHGCYDAPCQLKLSSYEGLNRGANKLKVYDKGRFIYQQPTRMFIDANSTDEWREKEFFSVVNETEGGTAEQNLKSSLLYQMLNLKQRNPLPESGKLPAGMDVSIDRKQVCTTIDDFGSFAADHPNWGMPYAVPGLSAEEYGKLVQWLAQGAKASPPEALSSASVAQVEAWETFFNASGNKQQLVSRYIYEHLVLGHIHFMGDADQMFFRLVRSRTERGDIDEIPTVRPYDDPQGVFYYRLRPYRASIVDKSHIVYELSEARMQRYEELFLKPDYEVKALPPYNPGEASQWAERFYIKIKKLVGLYEEKMLTPFTIFDAIPVQARYQFLLDDARFFINGFIKGPVCRGVGALSSIEDQFWVFFLSPENPTGYSQHGLDGDFLKANDNLLHLPTELGDTSRLLNAWIKYWPQEQDYMRAKLDYYLQQDSQKGLFPIDVKRAVNQFIWNGLNPDGSVNRNAALTVFRNLDSATVSYGLLGDEPETAWMLDYPVFERLHYLLVAGYNTFGTLGHQASARLYMDFLRTEGEDNFLFFLPVGKRKAQFEFWHGVNRSSTRKQNIDLQSAWLNADSVTGYASSDEQHELFTLLRTHVAAKSPDAADLNRCDGANCFKSATDRAMQRLANLSGKTSHYMPLQYFPALSYLRVDGRDAYTLIYNKTYRSYEEGSFIKEVNNRSDEDMRGDTLTVVKGLSGAYPNFFFDLKVEQLEMFVAACEQIRNQADYDAIVAQFGIRRTNPKFWVLADWFQALHAQSQPVESGILDLSRYNDH